MGKRRSRKAAPKKAMAKLPSVFDCPFCNHQTTIQVKINYGTQVGKLECRVCGVNAEVRTTHLSKEIDVYCEWMDTCVELNQGKSAAPEDEYGDPSAKRRRVVCLCLCLGHAVTATRFRRPRMSMRLQHFSKLVWTRMDTPTVRARRPVLRKTTTPSPPQTVLSIVKPVPTTSDDIAHPRPSPPSLFVTAVLTRTNCAHARSPSCLTHPTSLSSIARIGASVFAPLTSPFSISACLQQRRPFSTTQ